MLSGDTRRIVVLKGIPSNLIEEAILILKKEPEGNLKEISGGLQKKNGKAGEDFLVKEAESVINGYIKEHCGTMLPGTVEKAPVKSKNPMKQKKWLNTAINLALLGSACLLVFLIAKLV